MHARSILGRAGEGLAQDVLRRAGLQILECNYRCSSGEIDIVAARGDLLVFCEVKTRKSDLFGDPSEAVNWRKQRRLRSLAGCWLRERGGRWRDIRFDIVSVIVRGGRAEATHIPDAF